MFGALAVAAALAVAPAHAQGDCLRVEVTDPSGAAVQNATVSIGASEQPTDDIGVAVFCGLGTGPHSVVAVAEGLAAAELTVDQAVGTVTIQLALETLAEQLVVVGSRSEGRTVLESAVPVDLVTAEEITAQGDPDLANLVRNTVPSFNVNVEPISDGGTIVRPAGLRNLAPDHTLVLVNGKRRHRAAIIQWADNASSGSQGPDLSVIPSIAVRHVEVLRDGASAQYGSDAIAGVLNFALKDAAQGGSIQVNAGQFGEGDGESLSFAGNVGLPLGKDGFANLSLEYGNHNPTSRSMQRFDAQDLIDNGNMNVPVPAQIWGSPEVDDDLKFFGNFGKFLRGATQLYGHANYASKRVDGGFFYRNPHSRAGVYSADGGETLLVGDRLDAQDGVPDGSAGCPTVRVSGGQVLDPGNFNAILGNPNCFTFHQPFLGAPDGRPGGFTPRFGGNVRDGSLVGGLRGVLSGGLVWDASVGYGRSEVDFFIYNTVNASLGPDSPSEFNPGVYAQEELNLNFDLSYALSDRAYVAAGAEWREEEFTVTQGDEASWVIGPYAAQGFSGGSNGFDGFSPITAGSWSRSNYAVYGDLGLGGPGTRYTVDLSLRGERFSDFGTTINYKLAGRFDLAESLALRGSASSGFRAPSPGQQNAFNISTLFEMDTNDLINQGTIPPTSQVAAVVGGQALSPEKSRNFTAGAVVEEGPFSLSADYFRIVLRDRIGFSQDFELEPGQVSRLVAEGITSAGNLGSFRFFTNDFDTRTQGFDLVGTFAPPAARGRTVFSFLLNHTKTSVTEFNPVTISEDRINVIENALPKTRWSGSVRHRVGKFRLLGRITYWGGFFDLFSGDYDGEYVADLEVTYDITKAFSLAVGGQNLFNNYPNENSGAGFVGNLYPAGTPFGFNGGYYYTRLNYSWNKTF